MTDGKNIRKEIAAQKEIVSALRKEIFGIDKTNSSRYIKDFQKSFSRYRSVCPIEKVIDEAARSDIIYFGDYHPLKAGQEWALSLLAALKERGLKVILALEMLYEYQQESLDRWMKGSIPEEQFLETIDYESEWGFDWESYRRFFEFAKDPFVPIFGIDYEPRDQLRYIKKRDRMIAGRIAEIRDFFPGHIIMVVIGESHVAPGHLPAEVRKLSRSRYRETTIVQNIDELYWKLLRRSMQEADAVITGRGRYCIFTASPIIKYLSYREYIEYWEDQSLSEAVLLSIEEMVDNLLVFLTGSREGIEVTVDEEYRQPVEDSIPEIHRRKTYKAIATLLRSRRISSEELTWLKENLKNLGSCYLPSANMFLLIRYDRKNAAREAARFVLYAMRDEVGPSSRIKRTDEDRFYAEVFEAALAWTGAMVINPILEKTAQDPLAGCIDGSGRVICRLKGFSEKDTRDMAGLYKYHLKREKQGEGDLRPTPRLERLYRLGVRKRLYVVKALGLRLGEAIYRKFHEGVVSRGDIAALFREDFSEPGAGRRIYSEWVKRLSLPD